jgi:WXG100 family type VII secretion target
MATEIIQAQYEQLENIAARFGQHSDATSGLIDRVEQTMDGLRHGGWVGQGADAFFSEMDGTVKPAAQRLARALEEARSVVLLVRDTIQQAEEEAAAPFGGGAVESSDATAGPSATVGTAAEQSAPLVARDVSSLFSNDYMDAFVGIRIRGEDSSRLGSAMNALFDNPTGAELDRVLNEIADIRGVPPDQIRAQYQSYLQLREQASAIARRKGLEFPEAVSDSFHGEFMGSTAQLRYGRVVGDAFGIDPVFGALLNPTGGMVGPGNFAFNPGDDDAVGYHGIFHDAAGYMHNFHDMGPGYDYLGQESHRDAGNPLVGQQSGIRYWNEKLNPGLVTDVTHGVADYVIDTTESAIDTVDMGIVAARDFGDRVGDFMGDAFNEAQEFFDFAF